MAKPDAVRKFEKAVTEKSDDVLTCRAMRHNWKQVGGLAYAEPEGKGKQYLPSIRMTWECDRGCGVTRNDILYIRHTKGSMFVVVDRKVGSYIYPVDYTIPGVPRGARPSLVYWQELVRRANEEIAKAEKGQRERSN